MKKLTIVAFIVAALGLAYVASAQWDEDEEPQRLEDQQREETLFDGSIEEEHQESIHKPAKKDEKPADVPPPGTYETPAEEVDGPSRENP